MKTTQQVPRLLAQASTSSIEEIKRELERRMQRPLNQHELEQVREQEPTIRRAITIDWNKKNESFKRQHNIGHNFNKQTSLLKKKITNVHKSANTLMVK